MQHAWSVHLHFLRCRATKTTPGRQKNSKGQKNGLVEFLNDRKSQTRLPCPVPHLALRVEQKQGEY